MVLVPFYLHALGGNKLKAILPSGQKHQPSQASHSMLKDPPKKAAWVGSRHTWLLRIAWAVPSERIVQCYPEVQLQHRNSQRCCVQGAILFMTALSATVFYGQVRPIKYLPLSGGDFLLTLVGFGSGPCSKSGADIFKLRGRNAGILN